MPKTAVKAGFSEKIITPAVPVKMAGFDGLREATEVHDDLYAKVCVMESEEVRYAFVLLDLIGAGEELIASIQKKAEPLGISSEHVVICATHTHSGPAGTINTKEGIMAGTAFCMGELDVDYIQFVAEQAGKAVAQAIGSMEKQTLRIAETTIKGISSNRSRPDIPYDDTLLVYEFTGQSGQKNIFLRFSCHPTVLNKKSTVISADFPGNVYQRLSKAYAHVLYANGACGDISTRFTRKSADFKELERMGATIEEAVRKALETPVYDGVFDTFSIIGKKLEVTSKPAQDLGKLHQTYSQLEEGLEKISIYAEIEYAKHHPKPALIDYRISLAAFQNRNLVFMPAEIYSSLLMEKTQQDSCYIGYAGGYYLYLADELAYDGGEYEACMSPFAKGEAEAIIRQTEKWVREQK